MNISNMLCDLYDIKNMAKLNGFGNLPKDNEGTELTINDCINKGPIEGVFVDEPVSQVRMDDGTALCPMSDDEGNESGAIACMGEKVEVETIPVMRERI